MSQRFTSGKYAKAICDRCGNKVPYKKLKLEWTGLRVCPACWDPKTALEFPEHFPADPESLRDPRPDTDKESSNGTVFVGADDLGQTFSLDPMQIELGEVTVTIG